MGPKMNAKAVAGRERQVEASASKDRAEAAKVAAADAESWKVGGNARGASKAEAQVAKDAEKAAADAAKRAALAEDEEATSGIKTKKAPKKKGDDVAALLGAGLAGQKKPKAKGALAGAQAAAAKKVAAPAPAPSKPKNSGIVFRDERVDLEEEEDMLSGGVRRLNVSIDPDDLDGTGIDGALGALGGGGGGPPGSGPPLKEDSKNRKALFNAYKERMMPIVKEEHPGLRLRQYDDRIFEMWKKAPENPANRDAAREATVPAAP